MTHWAMVIDLRHCIGCKSCIIACSQANDIEEGLWRKYQELGDPEPPHRQRFFITAGCMQCSKPACLPVCPTTATYQRPDGIVTIDDKKCIGCGACIMACPYDARSIYTYRHDFETNAESQNAAQEPSQREGTCTKCNFCLPRIQSGLPRNLQPGRDDEATPLCVATCSTGTLNFGDLDDPDSNVSRLIKENKTTRLVERVGTDPSVYYILPQ